MPPIPKFAQVLAKRANAKPKKISVNSELPKGTKDDMELVKVGKQEIRKSLKKYLPKKPKDDLKLLKDLKNFKANDKLRGHKAGNKVKIFNKDNLKQFVEISWPEEATAYNVVESVVCALAEKYIKK